METSPGRKPDALGDSESAEAQWLGTALEEARRAAQERPVAIQVEECLTRMEQELVGEQKELDAAQVRFTREEIMSHASAARCDIDGSSPVASSSR